MAACAHCGTALPRGATACPGCHTPVVRLAKQAPAKPARARPAATPPPVVKAVGEPVTPTVKGGTRAVRPTPKVAPRAEPGTAPRRRRAAAAAEPPPPRRSAGDVARRARSLALSDDAPVGSPARRAAALAVPVPEATPPPPAPAPLPELSAPAPEVPAPGATAAPPEPVLSAPGATGAAPEPVPVPEPAVAPWRTRRAATARPHAGDVIGEADERDPHDPVVPLPPLRAPLPPVLEERYESAADDPRRGWPLPLRVLRGDWVTTLRTAGPALVATVLVAAVACGSLFLATRTAGDELLVGDLPGSRWLRYVAVAVGLAFGGPLSVSQREVFSGYPFTYDVRVAPLTITAASLVALWVFARRAYRRNAAPDRLPDAIRVALVYAAGVVAVTRFARWSVGPPPDAGDAFGPGGTAAAFSMAPWRPLFWAFCAAFAVTWTATGRFVVHGRLAGWLLAARGALVGLAAGGAVSFLLLVALGYAYTGRLGGSSSDVTNAIPLALGFAPGLAAGVFGVAAGGQLRVPLGERSYWSIWAPWLPGWYALLLVVPALAVAAGVYYLTRRRDVPPAEVLRACRRMAVPAAVAWYAVAAAGTAYLQQDSTVQFLGSASAGPVLWDALLVGLWFGAGGRLAAWLLPRFGAPFDQPADGT